MNKWKPITEATVKTKTENEAPAGVKKALKYFGVTEWTDTRPEGYEITSMMPDKSDSAAYLIALVDSKTLKAMNAYEKEISKIRKDGLDAMKKLYKLADTATGEALFEDGNKGEEAWDHISALYDFFDNTLNDEDYDSAIVLSDSKASEITGPFADAVNNAKKIVYFSGSNISGDVD